MDKLPTLTAHYKDGRGWYVRNNRINKVITPYISNNMAEAIISQYNIQKIEKNKKVKDLYYYFGKKTT
tara:strand:- start:176 stop:379 length:204 start_codon:yes stop_codon:yes gene_type:complete